MGLHLDAYFSELANVFFALSRVFTLSSVAFDWVFAFFNVLFVVKPMESFSMRFA